MSKIESRLNGESDNMYTKAELAAFVALDADGREGINRKELIKLWQTIEYHQAEIAKHNAILQSWLGASPDLRADWNEFIGLGGVTAHELARFLDGYTIRRRR